MNTGPDVALLCLIAPLVVAVLDKEIHKLNS